MLSLLYQPLSIRVSARDCKKKGRIHTRKLHQFSHAGVPLFSRCTASSSSTSSTFTTAIACFMTKVTSLLVVVGVVAAAESVCKEASHTSQRSMRHVMLAVCVKKSVSEIKIQNEIWVCALLPPFLSLSLKLTIQHRSHYTPESSQ